MGKVQSYNACRLNMQNQNESVKCSFSNQLRPPETHQIPLSLPGNPLKCSSIFLTFAIFPSVSEHLLCSKMQLYTFQCQKASHADWKGPNLSRSISQLEKTFMFQTSYRWKNCAAVGVTAECCHAWSQTQPCSCKHTCMKQSIHANHSIIHFPTSKTRQMKKLHSNQFFSINEHLGI